MKLDREGQRYEHWIPMGTLLTYNTLVHQIIYLQIGLHELVIIKDRCLVYEP